MMAKNKTLCTMLSADMRSALLDQACVAQVCTSQDDPAFLIHRMEPRGAIHVLEYREEIGLGNRNCQLVSIDD